jgi:rhodanese-related sulfurtransferase
MRNVQCLLAPFALAVIAAPAAAEPVPNPQIDYRGYMALVQKLEPVRNARLVAWPEFHRLAKAKRAILLDPRTPDAFAKGHLKGAVNVPLTDFSADRLREVLGEDTDRPIFLYCNNHFRENRPPVVLKTGKLAIAIPTFISLYGYGYENVWELADVIGMDDPGVEWVTSEQEEQS